MGKLAPGPYTVGFRSLWQLDYSRVYNTTFDDKTTYATGKAPRPILINLWYPAERTDEIKPMPHRDYLKVATEDPRLARFAAKLSEYERNTVSIELIGKAVAKLNDEESRRFDRVWSAPTACLRDAPPLDARFPLIIYHSGAGSSYEDNAVFCEFLASRGYVVVGSAFQEVTGHTLAVDRRDGSMRDLEFSDCACASAAECRLAEDWPGGPSVSVPRRSSCLVPKRRRPWMPSSASTQPRTTSPSLRRAGQT